MKQYPNKRSPMKLYPFDEVFKTVDALLLKHRDANIYQQWTCDECGMKQTMETPNVFYKTGECEECRSITDIAKSGCNYMVHFAFGGGSDAEQN